jgi:hypothetical protein
MSLGQFGLTTNESSSDLTITAAGTVICDPVTSLTGMLAQLAQLRLAYGSGVQRSRHTCSRPSTAATPGTTSLASRSRRRAL